MAIYKINHHNFQYNEKEKEEFLQYFAGIYSVSDLGIIAEKESDIARVLFKEPRVDKDITEHTYTYCVHVNLDSVAQFEFNQYPRFVKNKEGKVGLLIGQYDIGWTLLFPSDPARFKVVVSETKCENSHNTECSTDTVKQSFNDLFNDLDTHEPMIHLLEDYYGNL